MQGRIDRLKSQLDVAFNAVGEHDQAWIKGLSEKEQLAVATQALLECKLVMLNTSSLLEELNG